MRAVFETEGDWGESPIRDVRPRHFSLGGSSKALIVGVIGSIKPQTDRHARSAHGIEFAGKTAASLGYKQAGCIE
jgi:hypothetical protein